MSAPNDGEGALEPTPPPAMQKKTAARKALAYKKKLDEAATYVLDEDKGGFGSKNTWTRVQLDAPNTTKCAWASESARFESQEKVNETMYDIDSGSGHRRSIGLMLKETPRRYTSAFDDSSRWAKDNNQSTSAMYEVDANPNNGSMSARLPKNPRRYFGSFRSCVERGFDPREGPKDANVPDYDFGDGPKPNFSAKLKTTPRTYCMMRSTEKRGPDTEGQMDPYEPYDTDVGKGQSLARNIELSAMEYANMRSKVDRFPAPDQEEDQNFAAQDHLSIGKQIRQTPRRYKGVSTKTPRFPDAAENQGGQDFYHVDTGHKKSIGAGIQRHPMRYRSSIGSQTSRFASEETGYGATSAGDPDGMNYNTDTGSKLSFSKAVANSARKYSQFRSKVPRFSSDTLGKKKGKKLDMDAVYEAELKRVTGVREPAEYYIPNFGAHRGIGETVKRSTRKYASSFQSKTPRFKATQED